MDLRVFGAVHWIYLAITVPLSVIGLLLAKKLAKTEKAHSKYPYLALRIPFTF